MKPGTVHPMKTRRKTITFVLILVALALIAGGIIWASANGSFGSKASPSGASATPDLTQGRSAAAALQKLTTDPAVLLPPDQKTSVDTAVAVPPGSTIDVNPATWAPANATSGIIEMTLRSPGLPDADFLVTMHEVDGHWFVVGTLPVGAAQ